MDFTLKQTTGRGGKRGGLRGRIKTTVTLGDGTVLVPLLPNATKEQKKQRCLALARERARRVHALKHGDTEAAKVIVGIGRAYASDGLAQHIEEAKESNMETKVMPRAVMTQAVKFKRDEARRLKNVIVHGDQIWESAAVRSLAIAAFLKTDEGKMMTQRDVAKRFGCVQSTVSCVWTKVQAGTM